MTTGDVEGGGVVGGLVGLHWGEECLLEDCYSLANVRGEGYIGGIVGQNGYSYSDMFPYCAPGFIRNCYATGVVDGAYLVGGLVGSYHCGEIEESYWDVQASNEPNMCGGWYNPCDNSYGKTTAQMKQQATFGDWDFVKVWRIGENQTYPYLRKYSAADVNQDESVDFGDLAILAENWLGE